MSRAVPRVEDARLLTGGGRYIDDVSLPNQAYAVFVRSPHAHAAIRGIDTAAAKAAPGVLAVLTGEDYAAAALGTIPFMAPPLPGLDKRFVPVNEPLATDRVRRVGDCIAAVIAESRNAAKDAAELVAIDYDPLPSVTETGRAAEPGAPPVWDEGAGNVAWHYHLGDAAATEAAIAAAKHVVRERFVINRLTASPLDTRGAVADCDPQSGACTVHAPVQGSYRLRGLLAETLFGEPVDKFRVITGDVGGSFGMKSGDDPETFVTAWASKLLGRPVKWVAERSEAFLSDSHARDKVVDAELALDADGKFLAVRVKVIANVGAKLCGMSTFPVVLSLSGIAGTYTTPSAFIDVTAVFSNTNTTTPYRGSGRPDACYIIERLVDVAARRIGIGPAELRRRNLIPPEAMPFKTPLNATYDGGDFVTNFETALEKADHAGFEARRAEARARGRLRGLGIASNVEGAAPPGQEYAEIEVAADGAVAVAVGSTDQGQGHKTMYTQILCERLGVAPEQVSVREGDTADLPEGYGTGGSKVSALGGSAVHLAALNLIDRGREIAAHLLEAAEADISLESGVFRVAGTDKSVGFAEVAAAAHDPARLPAGAAPGFEASGKHQSNAQNWPNGCHVCEVEVDPETGRVALVRYVAVDDNGVLINPLQVQGQIRGGIVQALGQALMEAIRYEPESGQLLTGSYMDYALPRAEDLCDIELAETCAPTETNPLGVKGAGELGTGCAVPAAVNAVVDALAPLGIDHLDMPLTAERIWRAIRDAGGAG